MCVRICNCLVNVRGMQIFVGTFMAAVELWLHTDILIVSPLQYALNTETGLFSHKERPPQERRWLSDILYENGSMTYPKTVYHPAPSYEVGNVECVLINFGKESNVLFSLQKGQSLISSKINSKFKKFLPNLALYMRVHSLFLYTRYRVSIFFSVPLIRKHSLQQERCLMKPAPTLSITCTASTICQCWAKSRKNCDGF